MKGGLCYKGAVEVRCPRCEREVAPEAVNVQKDLVYCARCNQAFGLSQLVQDERALTVDLRRPPPGVWFERTPLGFRLGATTRSGLAFFLVPFMLVWSGGQFGLLQSLFGLPFLAGSVLFWSVALRPWRAK